jgi:hypothetical protein
MKLWIARFFPFTKLRFASDFFRSRQLAAGWQCVDLECARILTLQEVKIVC